VRHWMICCLTNSRSVKLQTGQLVEYTAAHRLDNLQTTELSNSVVLKITVRRMIHFKFFFCHFGELANSQVDQCQELTDRELVRLVTEETMCVNDSSVRI